MCRPVRCKTCQKTTWSGCGMHVAHVRARVPDHEWCGGHDDRDASSQTWFGKFLGRRSAD